ncbi:C-5 cytosine-specific DNA methylase [Vibrio phage 1.225.O._10N.261.48.B7]|nr:C-5 cytosine-specific DNA methylase [Vibrio phage 1.225.O._10N.261.48.B7]
MIGMSLFDGKSSAYTACEMAGINLTKFYSSEIDKYAIQVSDAIHPNQIRLGDVTKWREWGVDWASIDIIFAGSPCQGLSIAGKQLALDDPRSMLFYVFADILNFVKSVNKDVLFMLENVELKGKAKESEQIISDYVEEESFLINSALVSAQNRKRNYWSNIPIDMPEDRGILLSSILEDLPDCPVGIAVRDKSKCLRVGGRNSPFGDKHEWDSPFQRVTKKGKVKPGISKAACLTGGGNSGGNHSDMDIIHSPFATRRYSARECFRLQTVPEHYIDKILDCGVSNSQLYKIAGNGWNDETIAHILRGI